MCAKGVCRASMASGSSTEGEGWDTKGQCHLPDEKRLNILLVTFSLPQLCSCLDHKRSGFKEVTTIRTWTFPKLSKEAKEIEVTDPWTGKQKRVKTIQTVSSKEGLVAGAGKGRQRTRILQGADVEVHGPHVITDQVTVAWTGVKNKTKILFQARWKLPQATYCNSTEYSISRSYKNMGCPPKHIYTVLLDMIITFFFLIFWWYLSLIYEENTA